MLLEASLLHTSCLQRLLFAPALGAHPMRPVTNPGAAPWQTPVPGTGKPAGASAQQAPRAPGKDPDGRRQLSRRTIARRAPLPAAPASGTARHTRPGGPVPAPGGPGGLPGPSRHHGGGSRRGEVRGRPPAVPGAGPRGSGGAGPGPAHTKGAPRTPPPAAAAPASPRRWALGPRGGSPRGLAPSPIPAPPPPRL